MRRYLDEFDRIHRENKGGGLYTIPNLSDKINRFLPRYERIRPSRPLNEGAGGVDSGFAEEAGYQRGMLKLSGGGTSKLTSRRKRGCMKAIR